MTTAKRIRPGTATEADEDHGQAISTQDTPGDRLAAMLSGVYVVVLTIDEDHARRRCYFNLPSAQRAADKAEQAGHVADIVLCSLDPVGVIL